MPRTTTCLWYDGQAEQAAELYTSIFPNSRITSVTRYPEGAPGPTGSVMTVAFELDGAPFLALNGGPQFQFTEAVSIVIDVEDQAELDRYWDRLTDGGEESMCGWLKDRFGLSWQVVPRWLTELEISANGASGEVWTELMTMKRIDLARLQAAAAG